MGILDRIKKTLFAQSPSASERAANDSELAGTDATANPDGHQILADKPASSAIPTELDLVRKITDWNLRPTAFQAMWDGDTTGWGLNLEVVHGVEGKHTSKGLAFLRFGGDFRLFTGEVPPWTEAEAGTKLGEALAQHYGVPFFFPSPREPDDDCPNWWERDKANHCEDCDKPIISKVVCCRCHLKRTADEELRSDAPDAPGGVKILLGQGDSFELLAYGSSPDLIIAGFALHDLGREAEASNTGQIVLEGPDLAPLEAHIDARVKALLRDFKPDTVFADVAPPEAWRTVTYEGNTLELEIQFDHPAREISKHISALESVRRAAKAHLRIWLVFRRGMTRRKARVIDTLRRHNALAMVEQIVGDFLNVLDEEHVRATIQQLEQLGHVCCSGEDVRLTETGKYV